MRFVVQVCKNASVVVGDKTVGAIDKGCTVLVGIGEEDTEEIADKMLKKLLALRIYPDENGKTNLSLADIGGSLLIISQFTLYADIRHGNRPSFTSAGNPDKAKALYGYIIDKCTEQGFNVQCGIFGAEMHLTLTNEGPFTIVMDSD